MRKKLLSLFLVLVASVGTMFAENVQIGDLYYNLDATIQTAEVTSQKSRYPYWSKSITIADIPSSVTYNSVTYSVTSIGDYAFSGCSGLTSVTIPNSVTSIGSRAFDGCTGLTSVTIPNSVTSIGDGAFRGCSGLTSVTIPNSVTSIGGSAFYNCSGLTSVTIPNSVTSIGSRAFDGCTGLTSVTIGNSVINIGEGAFNGCTGLTSVVIPNSVTSIGEGAFDNVPNIVYNGSAAGSPWEARSVNGFVDVFLVYADASKTTLLACSALAQGEIVIPNSVTSIGDYTFYNCTDLTSVTIPNSVTWIGNGAFSGCSSLTSFTIPNSVTSIGDGAFSDCSSLISIEIPTSITSIGKYTFSSCYSLTSVTIPNSVTSIGDGAFSGCMRIKKFIIPNSVTTIGQRVFYAGNLDTLIIGKNVQRIGEDAFAQYIPDITYQYLSGAPIKFVKILAPQPPSMSYTWQRPSSDAKFGWFNVVYVPYGSLDTYRNNERWKRYHLHTEGLSEIGKTLAPTSFSLIFGSESAKEHIVSCGMEEGEEFPGNIVEYNGLEPNGTYNEIPFFIKTNEGDYDTLHVSFTTSALELTTKPSKAVSSTTAILLAETNMSDAEVSCGFEYKRNDAPADMEGNKVYCPVASGQMAGRLKGLKDDVYYKYRAFYQSAAGNMFYGDWQYIFTGDVAVEFDPILYTYGATVVRENEATISGYALAGSEDFTEQGFEYWAESRTNGGANAPHRVPAALNEHFFVQASGIALRATLTNLDAGTVYKYRVYGKVGDQYYYGAEQSFATSGTYTPPTYTVTFANWDGAVLQSSQVEDGKMPVYSGETPVRPEDEQYTYTFSGWTPQIVAATTDATYTAQYVAKDKHEGLEDIQEDNIPCTKVIRNGQIFILRGEKEYTLTGQELK